MILLCELHITLSLLVGKEEWARERVLEVVRYLV